MTAGQAGGTAVGGFEHAAAQAGFRALWDYLVVHDLPVETDAIFCFGSRDRGVPRRAAELFAAGRAPLVLVSGGAPLEGDRGEADVFADDLVALGVPADRIVVERRSVHTGENVALGLRALRAHIDVRRVTAVSWPLASRRVRATFARQDRSLVVTAAPSLGPDDERWPATPRAVRAALGEWDRAMSYATLGYTVRQPRPLAVRRAVHLLREELARVQAPVVRPVGVPRADDARPLLAPAPALS